MASPHIVSGFSKLSRSEKLEWLAKQGLLSREAELSLNTHLHPDPALQDLYSEISENFISNFFLPLGLAPNFLINGDLLTVPMVIEESSVVAAASHGAKFWAMNGGFKCQVSDVIKVGQVHFTWSGSEKDIREVFEKNKVVLLEGLENLTRRMEARGGGIESMEIRKTGGELKYSYQLFVTFRTANAMGANFINSVLEALASAFRSLVDQSEMPGEFAILMAILSNYTPDCLVSCTVETNHQAFDAFHPQMSGKEFAEKFYKAVEIARQDPYRAVTHNKGILNGVDAVILATGNDFRAVEACAHAYASRDGQYRSLSNASFSGNVFRFSLEIPLAVGTVGGLTATHPLAAVSMGILGKPDSQTLMQIVAAAGLANNFSAVRSLITNGIQQGHMKMHLANTLRQLGASPEELASASRHFVNKTVSHSAVVDFLEKLRKQNKRS